MLLCAVGLPGLVAMSAVVVGIVVVAVSLVVVQPGSVAASAEACATGLVAVCTQEEGAAAGLPWCGYACGVAVGQAMGLLAMCTYVGAAGLPWQEKADCAGGAAAAAAAAAPNPAVAIVAGSGAAAAAAAAVFALSCGPAVHACAISACAAAE
eukprot:scaffold226801_cov20-Tisochrysis_lutea.AAC.1